MFYTLRITNTTFNNDNTILPYNLPLSTTLNGIIYNTAELTLDNVTFTNMNNRPLYNLGNATVKNTKFYSYAMKGLEILKKNFLFLRIIKGFKCLKKLENFKYY